MYLETSRLTIDFPVRKGPRDPFDFESRNAETGGEIHTIGGKTYVRARRRVVRARRRRPAHSWSATTVRASPRCCAPCAGSTTPAAARCGATTTFPASSTSTSGSARGIRLPQHPAERPDRRQEPREIAAAVPEIAEFAGLGAYLHMPMHTYSQGMAMRLAFAITTAFANHILVMDEWIGAGDANFQDKVVERMNSFFESADICVIASHNNRLLRNITNRCMWLDSGRVRAIGPTGEVLDAYEAEAMSLKLESARQAARLRPRLDIPPEHRAMWLSSARQDNEPEGLVLAWDVADYNVASIRVVTFDGNGKEQMVCTGGGRGTKFLGSWPRPGVVLALRDNVDDALLAKVEFGG